MRLPVPLDAFSKLARTDEDEIERLAARGLLDPDGDGLFDEFDVLRLRLLLHYRDLGYSADELSEAIANRGVLYADLLFGADPADVPIADASARAGLAPDDIRRLRRAAGLPGGDRVQDADVAFLSGIRAIVDAGVPMEAVLEVARVLGDALGRVAEAEVRVLRFHVDEPLEMSALSERERSERLQALRELLDPLLDPLVVHIHRQHVVRALVADAVSRLESTGSAEARGHLEATIVFADLASFTPLAEVHGDEVAANVLSRFDGLVREQAEAFGGNVVKQIGDAFMLTFDEPLAGVRFAVALDEAAVRERHFPALRAGVHHGGVLYRVGDYVGGTVNLASRIAALAAANEILVTKVVASAAAEADIEVAPAGVPDIRGLTEPVALYRVVRTGARATRRERDPVCGMLVGDDGAGRLMQGGFEFVFCSRDCRERFLAAPARYARRGGS